MKTTAVFATVLAVGLAVTSPVIEAGNDPVMPEITVLEPLDGATLVAPGFPFVTTLKFQIKHPSLDRLHVLGVKSGADVIMEVAGNPFDESDGVQSCRAVAFPLPRTCTVLGDNETAEVTVPWTIAAPGTYTLTFSIRQTGQAIEEEDIQVHVVVSAEHPAPPAVANAYIKATYGKLNAKAHGCVISKVAERHAKEAGFSTGYGPKGGPYDQDKIHADVNAWKAVCGG